MAGLGVGEDALLLIRRKVTVAGRYETMFNASFVATESRNREMEQDSEMMRLQILGDPELMRQLREVRCALCSLCDLRSHSLEDST